ncbi:MAG: hypothetical protein QOJ56_2992 [Mycobacterium sp.]|jgi:hypothetical protein|nr:hypothetical protein [Mycobacterium sp.]MDT5354460.1 hypothetical protein [Mycobacterium sp.]
MSRRNNLSEPFYGQIKLKCPYKHELGAILVQPRRPVPPADISPHRSCDQRTGNDSGRPEPARWRTQAR